jgi:hypothetical protein
MRRCIEIMRHESPESREQIDCKLKDEGFEKAGQFAAYAVQCDTLRLKPWEAPPCCVWGYDQSGGSNCASVWWRPDSASSNLIRSRHSRKPNVSSTPRESSATSTPISL